MSAPQTAWVISDGRRGIENQAFGLAEALGRQNPLSIERKTIANGTLFKLLPAWTQFKLRKNPKNYIADSNYPNIAIGCGRQAIAPLLALKRKLKEQIYTIYVQNPRLDPSYFDRVIAPEHDKLTGPNVINIIGSTNRVTLEKLGSDKALVPPLKGKTAAWLIGGASKTHQLTKTIQSQHLDLLRDLLFQGYNILVSTSRRTPENVSKAYLDLQQNQPNLHIYSGEGENPYFAYLHRADMIFVTEDSTNMLTEACVTGKPVFRLPMFGNPGKFQTLYDTLEKRCRVRPALGSDLAPQAYQPLNETDRAARLIWDEIL